MFFVLNWPYVYSVRSMIQIRVLFLSNSPYHRFENEYKWAGPFRSQTCNWKKGSDVLKRWVEAQHNIFKLKGVTWLVNDKTTEIYCNY